MRSPGQFEHALIRRAKAGIAEAALTNGLAPTHGLTLDLKNTGQVYSDASRTRNEFGFLRMWSILPGVDPANDRCHEARLCRGADRSPGLLAAQQAQWGPIQFAGRLQEAAAYRYCWELLKRARLTGVAKSETARAAFFGQERRQFKERKMPLWAMPVAALFGTKKRGLTSQ